MDYNIGYNDTMNSLQKRAEMRRKRGWNVRFVKLKEDHETLLELSVRESLELLYRLGRDSWYLQTGRKATDRVDKSIVKIRKLGDICT